MKSATTCDQTSDAEPSQVVCKFISKKVGLVFCIGVYDNVQFP